MNFAPYQDQSPETERALSPPPQGQRSNSPSYRPFSPQPVPPQQRLGSDGRNGDDGSQTGLGGDAGSGRTHLDAFETSLPMRLDYEAMLAYLLLPPAGGVFLLLMEHKSDYVRYVTLNT